MAKSNGQDVLGRTLVNFSRDGMFPEEDDVSAMQVESSALPAALSVLASARSDLEVSRWYAMLHGRWAKTHWNETCSDGYELEKLLIRKIRQRYETSAAKTPLMWIHGSRTRQRCRTISTGQESSPTRLFERQKLVMLRIKLLKMPRTMYNFSPMRQCTINRLGQF